MLTASTLDLRLPVNGIDYFLICIYFSLVLGIGLIARRSIAGGFDFLLSGRSLPAWITGLAFLSANLGAVELIGMTASGAQYGISTAHFYWIGAVPAMVFLGIVMMPFYYGSKVRSVPEFMRKRFGNFAHLVTSISFATAQVLVAGINLYLMALVVELILGWPMWVAVITAAAIVLIYTFLGGLSAAIYNEVMQFFVILALLVPITVVGLHRVGGYSGLMDKVVPTAGSTAAQQTQLWPGVNLTGIASSTWSVLGIVIGLGFVLSFGYWTTNFAEVQRALSARSMSAARRTPLIAAFPKALVVLAIAVPGMIAAVLVPEINEYKQALAAGTTGPEGITYNNALTLLMRDLLPNGMLGVAVAGLLAAFMAGMAANISSLNTVVTYDIWQTYIKPGHSDHYYLSVGRTVTIVGCVLAAGTTFIASQYNNILDYMQALFGYFNAPLFATFIIGMFWSRMTPLSAGFCLIGGTSAAILTDKFHTAVGLELSGQGSAFVAAIAAFVVAAIIAVGVSMVSKPRDLDELTGLVWARTDRKALSQVTEDADLGWYRKPAVLGSGALLLVLALNIAFW